MCFYLDDIIIIGSNDKIIKFTKDTLNSRLDMNDVGLTDVIFRIKILIISKGLADSHYVEKILEKFDKDNSTLVRTSIDISQHLSKNRDKNIF